MSNLEGARHLTGQEMPAYVGPDRDILDVLPWEKPEVPQVVGIRKEYFTTLGPENRVRDFATLDFAFIPNELIVESKSLREYLKGFEDEVTFYEDCIAKICADLFDRMRPKAIRVIGWYAPMGRIAMQPMSMLEDPNLSEAEISRCDRLFAHYDNLNRNKKRNKNLI